MMTESSFLGELSLKVTIERFKQNKMKGKNILRCSSIVNIFNYFNVNIYTGLAI